MLQVVLTLLLVEMIVVCDGLGELRRRRGRVRSGIDGRNRLVQMGIDLALDRLQLLEAILRGRFDGVDLRREEPSQGCAGAARYSPPGWVTN
jgi:hypothetical protein